jgi:hypothetical protein
MAHVEFNYPELFAALGKFIAGKKMHAVCIMEFEDGVIVTGSVVYESRGGLHRAQETVVLSHKELERLTGKRGFVKE